MNWSGSLHDSSLAHPVSIPECGAAGSDSVSYIVGGRPRNQVVWADAHGDMAAMTDKQTIRNRPVGQLICQPMGTDEADSAQFLDSAVPVIIQVDGAEPARVSLDDAATEPLFQSRPLSIITALTRASIDSSVRRPEHDTALGTRLLGLRLRGVRARCRTKPSAAVSDFGGLGREVSPAMLADTLYGHRSSPAFGVEPPGCSSTRGGIRVAEIIPC